MDKARLLQYATPAEILTHPAEAYVERLVGTADRPFRLLSLAKVEDAVEPGSIGGQPVDALMNLRDALSQLVWSGREALPVKGSSGAIIGKISVSGILAHGRQPA
jgi:osmoprotectant transport system ATP-binding protein